MKMPAPQPHYIRPDGLFSACRLSCSALMSKSISKKLASAKTTLRGITCVTDGGALHVPASVANGDLATFRHWADSDEYPEKGMICFLQGEVWADMSKQQIFTHLGVKGEYNRVLANLAKAEKRGRYFPDGLFLSNVQADIAVIPDGTFVSAESLATSRVRLIEGKQEGYMELEGSPDMVLEIISRASFHKDTVVLMKAYWDAGIQEYWLVDARQDPLQFDIYRHTAKGYSKVHKQA